MGPTTATKDLTDDILGGISRYKPIRNDLLVRDASCAAAARAQNAATIVDSAPLSANQDILQIQALIDQSRAAISRAVSDGDLDTASADSLNADLDAAEASLSIDGFETTAASLLRVCTALQVR